MPLVLLLLLVPVVVIALMPLLLIQRYRAGKARRLARPWAATLNLAVMAFSAVFFLITAAFTTIWIPDALAGAAIGVVVGFFSVCWDWLTRWEADARAALHAEQLAGLDRHAGRLGAGAVRPVSIARRQQAGIGGTSVATAFGVPESLAAGAMVIGYYLAFTPACAGGFAAGSGGLFASCEAYFFWRRM